MEPETTENLYEIKPVDELGQRKLKLDENGQFDRRELLNVLAQGNTPENR